MRILHVTPELPSPSAFSGGATRQYHLLRPLVSGGHSVTVVAPVARAQADDIAALERDGFDVRAHRRPPSRVREASAALLARPRLVGSLLTTPWVCWQNDALGVAARAQLRAAAADGPYDVVNVHNDYVAHWLTYVPAGAPVILDLDNVMAQYAAAEATRHTGLRRKWWRFEQRRLLRYGRRWFGRFDHLVYVSDEEREFVERDVPVTAGRGHVIANGADCAGLGQVADAGDDPVVLFTGTMAYGPNADGARWLAREIWPAIRHALPDARLLIVGRDPQADVMALNERDGIEVTGRVATMTPYFERAAICVAPLRGGAGTRLKIAEALAAGRPVVSTTLGAAGSGLRDGEHLLLADDAESFAAAMIRLLRDRDLRRALADAGRAEANARFDWRSLAADYERFLLGVAADS